jgi:antitoxin MazE
MLLRMNRRGAVTIPKEIRQALSNNTVFDVVRRADGVIELRPQEAGDSSQSWFWTERWQQMEREADEDIAKGRIRTFETVEELIAEMEK